MISRKDIKYHERQLDKLYDDIDNTLRELSTDGLIRVQRYVSNALNNIESAMHQLDKESFTIDVKSYKREL